MELGKVYCDRVFAITSFPRAQLHQGRDLIGKLRPRGHMRRTILTIAILGIVWIGYIAWPIYDLFVQQAMRLEPSHDRDFSVAASPFSPIFYAGSSGITQRNRRHH